MRSGTYWTTSLAVNNPNFSLHIPQFRRQDHSLHLKYQNVDFILIPSLLLTLKSVHHCYLHIKFEM